MAGVHLDKRLSPVLADGSRVSPGFLSFLAAGCGFGGSCFPKDVKALIAFGRSADSPMSLLESVVAINEAQPSRMLELLRRRVPDLEGARVTVLGMAFKPGTDDVRESPSLPVTAALLEAGAVVSAYDPVARSAAEPLFDGRVRFVDSLEEAVDGVEAVLVMTRWQHFDDLASLLQDRNPTCAVIDGRRVVDKHSVTAYEGIGV